MGSLGRPAAGGRHITTTIIGNTVMIIPSRLSIFRSLGSPRVVMKRYKSDALPEFNPFARISLRDLLPAIITVGTIWGLAYYTNPVRFQNFQKCGSRFSRIEDQGN